MEMLQTGSLKKDNVRHQVRKYNAEATESLKKIIRKWSKSDSNKRFQDIKKCIEADADPNCETKGRFALSRAVVCKEYGLMCYLLQNGADPDHVGQLGTTALRSAASLGDKQALQILFESGADVNIRRRSFGDYGALFQAISQRKSEIAVCLYQNGGRFDLKGEGHAHILTTCITYYDDQALQFLLDQVHCDPNSKMYPIITYNNEPVHLTLLQCAATLIHKRTKKIVQVLLDSGADLMLKSSNGMNALDYATKCNNYPIMQLLKSYLPEKIP